MHAAPVSLILRDTRDGRTIATLGMSTSATSFSAASALDVAPADREAMFQLLASGSAVLVVQLANDASVIVPLTVATLEDWHRPSCD